VGNRNLLLGVAVAVIVVAIGAFYLLSQNKAVAPSASPSPSATSEEMMEEESASPSASDAMMKEDSMMEEESQVTLSQSGFSPKTLTVKKGTTVTWVNGSGETGNVSSNNHPTHTLYSPLNLGNFSDGDSVTLTFDKTGTYGYHDHLNPQFTGTVVVQ